MRLALLITALILACGQILLGQCIPSASDYLYGPNVKAMVHNGGDMFWDLNARAQYEVPRAVNPNLSVHSGFASSVWVGGLDNQGTLRLAGQTYRQSGIDFYTGPYRSNGVYPCGPSPISIGGDPLDPMGIIKLSSGKVLVCLVNQVQIIDPNTGPIMTLNTPSTRTNFLPIELNDGRVWFVGQDLQSGFPILPTFILDTTNWSLTNYITPNFFHFHSTITRLTNGKVLVAGRNGCEVLDPATNQMTTVAPMGTNRSYHFATLLANGNVMVAGGNQVSYNSNPNLSSTEIYDPVANTWTPGPSMTANRGQASMTTMANGNVVIAGGLPGTDRIEVYNPTLNTLTIQGFLPGNLGLHAAVKDDDDEVYFFGNGIGAGGDLLLTYKFRGVTGEIVNTQSHMGMRGGVYLGNDIALVKLKGMVSGEYGQYNTAEDRIVGDRYQKIWKVSRDQINQFQQDFGNGTVNFALYPDILSWPAHGDVNAGEPELLAPFVDVNNDGRYRPAQDGDFPCIKGDNALWWVYNDDAGPHTETGGLKIGLQFEVMAYTFDCATRNCPDSLLDYATFYHYKVTNKSLNFLQGAYMGLWMDLDLGNYWDDYIGCDTTMDLAFVYNGDNIDENQYGYNPPAAGSLLLTTPQNLGMTHFMTYDNDLGVNGNPSVAADYFNYLQSNFLDGQHLVNNGMDGYPGTASGPAANHFFTGDPGFCGGANTGWNEVSAGNSPWDRRYLQSFGPFRLTSGEVMEMDFAFLWARDTSNFASVCRLKDLASTLRPWWMAQDSSCPTIIVGQSDPQGATASSKFVIAPNPSQGSTTVVFPEMVEQGRLSVWNSVGQCVYDHPLAYGADRHQINQENLPTGVYHIVAEANGQKWQATWVIAQ